MVRKSPSRRSIDDFRDIAAEAILVAAGGRAILLQLANPLVGRGVADHSDFDNRPLDRLNGTLSYAYTVVYGSADDLAFVQSRVNRAHGPVHSAPDAPDTYSAFDPALQLWVAATLYDSAIVMYETIFGPLAPETAERVYRDYRALGTALQMPESAWPSDRAAFRAYWVEQERLLRVDDRTRETAFQVLHPRAVGLPIRLTMPLARLVTAGLLSPTLRQEFRLPWGPRRARRFRLFMGISRAVFPRLPAPARHLLRDHYLRELRAARAAAVRSSRSARS